MDRQVPANQPDIIIVEKDQKILVVMNVEVPNDSNNRKEYEKLKKYQGLKEELKRMWKAKANMVPVEHSRL